MFRHLSLAALAVTLSAGPTVGQGRSERPEGPSPTIRQVSFRDGQVWWKASVPDEAGTGTVVVEGSLDPTKCSITRANGRPVSPEQLPELLAKPAHVCLSVNGRPVDRHYLSYLARETLVIVPPQPLPLALHSGATGGGYDRARLAEGGKTVVVRFYYTAGAWQEEFTYKVKTATGEVEKKGIVTRKTLDEQIVTLPLAVIRGIYTDGEPIPAEHLPKLLAAERPVLVVPQGEIHTEALTVFRKDVPILALPAIRFDDSGDAVPEPRSPDSPEGTKPK